MDSQVRIIKDAYQRQIEENLVTIQNKVESSFKNIDAYLDSLLDEVSDSFNIFNKRSLQTSSYVSSIDLPQTKFDNLNIASQLYQNIQQLITNQIKNQVQLKEESVDLQHKQQIEELYNVNSEQTQTIQSIHQSNLKSFNYQLIQEYSIAQNDQCCAIAINQKELLNVKKRGHYNETGINQLQKFIIYQKEYN